MGTIADDQPTGNLAPRGLHFGDLLKQRDRFDHQAIADHTQLAFMQDARGDQVQHMLLIAHLDGMAGIVAALEADHHVGVLGEHVDDLAFTLIAPLGPDQYCIGHLVSPAVATVHRPRPFSKGGRGRNSDSKNYATAACSAAITSSCCSCTSSG